MKNYFTVALTTVSLILAGGASAQINGGQTFGCTPGQAPAGTSVIDEVYADAYDATTIAGNNATAPEIKGSQQMYDIHYPTNADCDRHAIVWFHGGGNIAGDKSEVFVGGAEANGLREPWKSLVDVGKYVVISANYRLLEPGHTAGSNKADQQSFGNPTAVHSVAQSINDAHKVIQQIRFKAADYGIDPNKIIAGGNSFGANLASQVTLGDDIKDPLSPITTVEGTSSIANLLWFNRSITDFRETGGGSPTDMYDGGLKGSVGGIAAFDCTDQADQVWAAAGTKNYRLCSVDYLIQNHPTVLDAMSVPYLIDEKFASGEFTTGSDLPPIFMAFPTQNKVNSALFGPQIDLVNSVCRQYGDVEYMDTPDNIESHRCEMKDSDGNTNTGSNINFQFLADAAVNVTDGVANPHSAFWGHKLKNYLDGLVADGVRGMIYDFPQEASSAHMITGESSTIDSVMWKNSGNVGVLTSDSNAGLTAPLAKFPLYETLRDFVQCDAGWGSSVNGDAATCN